MSSASSAPDPGSILDALCAFQLTEALKGAIDLDLFTQIAAGAVTASGIAERVNGSERGIRILCDYLTIRGFLSKEGDRYALSPTAAVFLDKARPSYIGSMANFLANDRLMKSFRNLGESARKGGTVATSTVSPNDPVWVEFARSMAPFIGMIAGIIAPILATPGRAQKVLDVAAGHGLFGVRVAQANPSANVYGTDWAAVLTVAVENATAAGVADRYHTIPGSAFDVELGTGYDLVLVPNFLHHFDKPTNVSLLKKLRRAMTPGGTIAVVEFVPNEDRVSPPIAAAFSLQMLGGTEHGEAYTFSDLDAMLAEAGFSNRRAQPLAPTPQTLVTATA
ncbi:MAG TPA: class I SAM-dependent methyltransferase [Vicinamibacterales bacterium]